MKHSNKSGLAGILRCAGVPLALGLATAIVGRDRNERPADRIDRAIRALSPSPRDLSHPIGRATAVVEALDLVNDQAGKDALLTRILRGDDVLRVGFANAHAINLAWKEPDATQAFLALDVLLRDGSGLAMLLRRLGKNPGINMNGTDFIPEILLASRGRSVAIYGTRDPWLASAVDRLRTDGHDIVDSCDGFLEPGAYSERFAETSADIVLLAMGMPKQEKVAQYLPGGNADRPALILCGGAIVDFLSRRHRRAPHWMRRAGIEWVFRLLSEPVRLFRRYIVGNVTFLMRTAFLPGRRPACIAVYIMSAAQRR